MKNISFYLGIPIFLNEEVAASTEEQSASIDEIAHSSTELAKLAEKLQKNCLSLNCRNS
jgi:hypothetical protein